MRNDDEIEKAIEAGKRNAEAMKLMSNWCSHARAKRMGGVGMVEQATGLPISHFAMECDHAPDGGMACWDFGESTLDFYDRHCITCKQREPVGIPNLSKLVAERDEAKRVSAARQKVENDKAEQALALRCEARANLRGSLDAINQALVDDLDSYDRNHNDVDRKRLVEAAKLVPERLNSELVDLIFDQSSQSTFIALIALEFGLAVAPNERRTVLLAQRLFFLGIESELLSKILTLNLTQIGDDDLVNMVPAAGRLASPDHREFFGGREPRSDIRLLLTMWDEKPEAVRKGIDHILDRRTANMSQLAGRTMRTIIERDPKAAKVFVRAAATRYVRAKKLLNDLGSYENLGDMAGAIDLIWDIEPDTLDSILQDLNAGADIEAQRNIANVYRMALRNSSFDNSEKPPSETRLKIGFDRVIWLPSKIFDQDVLSTVSDALGYPPDEIWPLIDDNVDKLVGAALLLDEQVTSVEAQQSEDAAFFEHLERRNLRSAAYNVVETFLKAGAKASRSDVSRMRFLEAIQAIPEDRELLRGIAVKATVEMASDVAGLKAVLPMLYSGMVGASVLGRAEAASALSDIPSRNWKNLPPLVYEVFCALLLDQFVAVHKSAVQTLRRISLPEHLRPRAGFAMFKLVSAYANSENDDSFLSDCIEELASLAKHLPDPDKTRAFCCEAALKAQPVFVRSGIRSLRHSLKDCDDFALVVIHVLPVYIGNMNSRDEEAELIHTLSPSCVFKHKDKLLKAALEFSNQEMRLSTLIADALYRAGASDEANKILAHMELAFAVTIKDKSRAFFVGFLKLAYQMEQALFEGDDKRWSELSEEWKAKVSEQNKLKEESRARDSRNRFPFSD